MVSAADAAGVAALRYSLVNVRSGESWNGTQWVGVSPPFSHEVSAATSFELVLKPAAQPPVLRASERARLEVTSTDALGNTGTAVTHFNSYSEPGFVHLYPSWDAPRAELIDGRALVIRRLGEHGLCIVEYEDVPNQLFTLYSPDGGTTWTKTPITGVAATEDEYGPHPMPWALAYDAAGEHGVLVGEDGLVVRLDGTCKSEEVVAGFTGWIQGVAWDGAKAFLAGDNGVFSSTDSGHTWTKAPLVQQRYSGVAVAEPGHVLVVGQYATLAESRDGGASFAATQPFGDTTTELSTVAVAADGTVYVGGPNLAKRKPTGQTTWLELPALDGLSPQDEYELVLVYPTVAGTFAAYGYSLSGANYFTWVRLSADGQSWARVVFDSFNYEWEIRDDLLAIDRYSLLMVGEDFGSAGVWYTSSGGD
ncbi:MAG: hypothetical protein QM765_49665 [Myxococcales bacterium]